jgi:undecaprenyl diphosphate synthase
MSSPADRITRTPASLVRHGDPRSVAPKYIAIIADGNGRWAQARDLPVRQGHEAGADTLKVRLRDAIEFGIEQLTVFFFSTENWTRPKAEIQGLIEMLAHRIRHETPDLHHRGILMHFIGRREGIPQTLLDLMDWAEQLTAVNNKLTLFVAVNYGSRAEIIDAAARYNGGGNSAIRSCLYAPEMCDPDLVIRTGGEKRLSNFLMWQAAFSQLVFRDELWPDFTRAALEEALAEFDGWRYPRPPTLALRGGADDTFVLSDRLLNDETE